MQMSSMKYLSPLTTQTKIFKMYPWSDSPHPNFQVKFFVDTNILVYLVDKTYPSLINFIELSRDSKFVELVSSNYVIFEFIGVRKKEHYLRKVANSVEKSDKGEINFSSLLTYHNKFEAPEVPFESVAALIKADVKAELDIISTTYDINYDFSTLHKEQLEPTSDICLETKIGNQDSLVLVSAILPKPGIKTDNLYLITNDADFVNFFEKANIDHLFTQHNLQKPSLVKIDKIENLTKSILSLKNPVELVEIQKYLNDSIIKMILEKNRPLFLGKTITPTSPTFPKDLVCFKFNLNTVVPKNIYLTVISKDLSFIYTSKKKIIALHHGASTLAKGHIFTDEAKNKVSYKLVEIDDNGEDIPPNFDMIEILREEGHYVFIHPDSFL